MTKTKTKKEAPMAKRRKLKNKIGYCPNKYLGINKKGGHYVFIRNIHKNGTCDVNVITSLEDKNKKFSNKKLRQVRKGNTYAIPFYDSNFTRWSGINKKPIQNVKASNIEDVGKKKIKRRHFFFINKFMK